MTQYNPKPALISRFYQLFILLLILLSLPSCNRDHPTTQRIYFPSGSWQRYSILKFGIPVVENEKSFDIIFELKCTKTFVYDELPLNMVLDTPSGEERIKEYQMQIRDKNGTLAGTLNGDTCTTRIFLKKNLYCPKKGVLKVEIENLNPRMETEGVFSASLVLIKR